MQEAQKVALEKEAELARQEQELTRREAAVNAKRDLRKTLGGVSVTSKKKRAPPKNKGGPQPNAFQQEHWPGINAGPLKGPTESSQRRPRINNPFFFDVAEKDAGLNNDLEEEVLEIQVPRHSRVIDDDALPDKKEEAEGDGPAINFGSEGSGKGSGRPNSFGGSYPSREW
jgi:hypothetical protein